MFPLRRWSVWRSAGCGWSRRRWRWCTARRWLAGRSASPGAAGTPGWRWTPRGPRSSTTSSTWSTRIPYATAPATCLYSKSLHILYTWYHIFPQSERSSWHVELDIWAPQILLVEQLCSRDSALLLVDFGRLRLANANQDLTHHAPADDEGMTCSSSANVKLLVCL